MPALARHRMQLKPWSSVSTRCCSTRRWPRRTTPLPWRPRSPKRSKPAGLAIAPASCRPAIWQVRRPRLPGSPSGMRAMLPKFYPVVPDVSWVERLASIGVKLIQLRMKEAPAEQIPEAIRRALEACTRYGCELVVNDYWQDAINCGARFVHLGQGDLEMADVAAIRRTGLKLGISTHNYEELDRALGVSPDYVALGPIYETKLKVMPWAPQGLA